MTFSRPTSLGVRSSERHLREISRSYISFHSASHWIALHTMRYIVCFICRTPRGDSRVQSSVVPDCATLGTHPTYDLSWAARSKLAMLPISAMSVAAASGPMPGIDVRIFPSRESSTTWMISVSNSVICSAMRLGSMVQWNKEVV